MPEELTIVAGGDDRLAIREDDAAAGVGGVFGVEGFDFARGGFELIKGAVHAGEVGVEAIRMQGKAEGSGGKGMVLEAGEFHGPG
jgi:hypothetical protein